MRAENQGKTHLVSVVIPTFGRPEKLRRAVSSVLAQTYKNVEIIVVDDNNPDSPHRVETEAVMREFCILGNVVYLQHETNKNGSAARNTGFKASKGKYVMFLDDDDEFLPKKIEAQVECLSRLDNSWGACYTRYLRKQNGKIVARGAETRQGHLLREVMMRNIFVHAGSNLMIRRSIIEEIGGFDESFLRNQDLEFLCRILSNYKLAYVDELGLIVNVHKGTGEDRDFERITADFLGKFSGQITQLPEKDQRTILTMINLQLIRYYFSTKGKRKKAFELIRRERISLLLLARYFLYSLKRRITRRVYGFRI